MTQEDLAEASGMERCTISHLETGAKSLQLQTMVRVAQGLGMRLALVPIEKPVPDKEQPGTLSLERLVDQERRLVKAHEQMVADLEAGRTPAAPPDDTVIDLIAWVRAEIKALGPRRNC